MESHQLPPPLPHLYAGLGVQAPGNGLDQLEYIEVLGDTEDDGQPQICMEHLPVLPMITYRLRSRAMVQFVNPWLDKIQDMIQEFNVDKKAERDQLNLAVAHVTRNKKK